MDQLVASDEAFFGPLAAADRKSQASPPVRGDMRYVLLVILIGLLVFLSNQLWILFEGSPLF
jgi:hypothetical protein